MTGTGSRWNPSQQRCTRVMNSRALSVSSAASSLMSAPPTKARSPAPVTITSRSSGSTSSAFTALSPFLVIASSDPSGRCDASPKGDAPGFVKVIDDQTLLIPDRLGNNRVDTIGNLLARPGVGLIFFVPGINETLRVNG